MSGLCTAVAFDGSAVDPGLVEAMVSAARHLAVDGSSTWSGEGAGAGHLRLDVAPEDASDRQPRVAGRLVCVADARLDNRRELLDSLAGSPLLHDEQSASALLAAAYDRWGARCAERVVGDFAFVVWDTEARTLFAARDPMGARTLFYRHEPGRRALVGTSVAQVLAAEGVPDRPDETSVLADVAGLYALPERSHHEGVDQLAPGHALLLDATAARTWRFRGVGTGALLRLRRVEEYAERFGEVLAEAVRVRVRGDRPAGLLLSGGLDSTTVAALAAHAPGSAGTTCFSWAFDELSEADERHVSGPLAAELGLPVVDVPADDAWPLSGWPAVGPHRDDPCSWLYQELFERTAQQAGALGVRTLLTADRGDEMTGSGWISDELGLLAAGRLGDLRRDASVYRARTGDSAARFAVERLVKPFGTTVWPPGRAPGLRRALHRRVGGPDRPFPPWVPAGAAARLSLRDVVRSVAPVPRVAGQARLQRTMAVNDVLSLRVAALRQRTFTQAGVQHADPWGDERVAAFVCAVPQWVVQRQGQPKRLTAEAVRGVLPDRPRTTPARPDQSRLFRRGFDEHEVSTVRSLLRDSRAEAAGLLDARAVLAVYEGHLRGEPLEHDIWHPLTVELWLRRWWG